MRVPPAWPLCGQGLHGPLRPLGNPHLPSLPAPFFSPPPLPCRLTDKEDKVDPTCTTAGCELYPNANAKALGAPR